MLSHRNTIGLFLALTASLLVAAPAPAQDTERLDEIVVTATRIATPIDEVASAVSVITRDDIERRQ